jgi:toxin secretion/phage lysis holin
MNENTLKAIIAVLGGFLSYYLGGVNSLLTALITLMVLDYVSGVVAAWFEKKLDSEIGFKGIVKKVMMLFLVAVAVQIDIVAGTNGVTRSAVICFILANEGLSILENLTRMDIGIPPVIKEALQRLKQKGEIKKEIGDKHTPG